MPAEGRAPEGASDGQRALRAFKDALSGHAVAVVGSAFSEDGEEERAEAAGAVRDAYAAVLEHRVGGPETEGKGPAGAGLLRALRRRAGGRPAREAGPLPDREVLAHALAGLEAYFFEVAEGSPRVYDTPGLTDEERAAEHGLRHDLLLALYEELEPAFDVSLSWPPNGYEVGEDGELVGPEETPEGRSAAIGYDHGYDFGVFYEGSADDGWYVEGFVEGSLERIGEEGAGEERFLEDLWGGGDAEDRSRVLEILKAEVEVREGRHDDRRRRPEFPA